LLYFPSEAITSSNLKEPKIMNEGVSNKVVTILVAEDDSMIAKAVKSFLRREHLNIVVCTDGREALMKFEEIKPDLVITDIMLPYLSGLEIVGKIKQSSNPVPVIVSSSMSQQSVEDEAKRLGADEFLSKPYNINELLSCVSRLVPDAALV
jgi:DNA-binding response OmpR family regulator